MKAPDHHKPDGGAVYLPEQFDGAMDFMGHLLNKPEELEFPLWIHFDRFGGSSSYCVKDHEDARRVGVGLMIGGEWPGRDGDEEE